jgi:hypothetical protein
MVESKLDGENRHGGEQKCLISTPKRTLTLQPVARRQATYRIFFAGDDIRTRITRTQSVFLVRLMFV